MTATGATFLTSDWQETTHNAGGVLAAFVRRKYPRDTIKQTARALDCTLNAAANVTKGHASERMITRALAVWHWELAEAFGHAFSGLTREQHLEQLVGELERAAERQAALRDRHRELASRAASLGL
jgi:hypothetical protein